MFGVVHTWNLRGIKAVASTAVPQGITSSLCIWKKRRKLARIPAEILKRNTGGDQGGRGRPSPLPRDSHWDSASGGRRPPFLWADVCQGRLRLLRVFLQEVPAVTLCGISENKQSCHECICHFLLPHVLRPPVSLVGLSKWKILEISLVLDMSDFSERAFLLNWLVKEYITFTFPRPLGMPKQHKIAELLMGKNTI